MHRPPLGGEVLKKFTNHKKVNAVVREKLANVSVIGQNGHHPPAEAGLRAVNWCLSLLCGFTIFLLCYTERGGDRNGGGGWCSCPLDPEKPAHTVRR